MAAVIALLLVGLLIAGTRTASPIDVAVDETDLVVRLHGKDALYSLSRGVRVPLDRVRSVKAVPRTQVPRTGMRLPAPASPA